MADYEDQQEGVIRSHVEFAEAAANGSRTMVEFLLENGAHVDAPGRDGTTPICAAALWGNDSMVSFLLERGANIGARNEGTGWTALHAAAFQEHGKAVRVLLDRGADPKAADVEGRTPIDYASISEAIWPFFAACGCRRSQKSELVAKGIIRKIQDQPEQTSGGDSKYSESLSSFSRPGSSYTRAQFQLPVAKRQGTAAKSRDGRPLIGPIDPLGDAPVQQRPSNQRHPSLHGLGL
ncbi:hypothetical protein Gpo141_00006220 [Globisporangium polare]